MGSSSYVNTRFYRSEVTIVHVYRASNCRIDLPMLVYDERFARQAPLFSRDSRTWPLSGSASVGPTYSLSFGSLSNRGGQLSPTAVGSCHHTPSSTPTGADIRAHLLNSRLQRRLAGITWLCPASHLSAQVLFRRGTGSRKRDNSSSRSKCRWHLPWLLAATGVSFYFRQEASLRDKA